MDQENLNQEKYGPEKIWTKKNMDFLPVFLMNK